MKRLTERISARGALPEMRWYGRLLFGSLVVIATAATVSSLTAKRAEGLVATYVQVVNGLLGVDVENPARLSFEQAVYLGPSETTFSVPAGYTLVIEDVDGSCDTRAGGPLAVYLSHYLPPGTPGAAVGLSTHTLNPVFSGSFGDTLTYIFERHLHVYAGAGTNVGIGIRSGNASSTCAGTVSGYLIKAAS